MNETKKRIDYYDIAKGIGIILVVWAHAKGPFHGEIFEFHMPLFFIISGLLYNSKTAVFEFAKKRFFSLYIPFIFWNMLIFLFKCFWYKAGIKDSIWLGTKYILTLDKDGAFFGATWFLGALFVMSVFYKMADTVLNNFFSKNDNVKLIKEIILLAMFFLMMVVAFRIRLPFMQSRTVILGFYYALGAFYKKYKDTLNIRIIYRILLSVAFVILFIFTSKNNAANMGMNEYQNPVLFVINALGMSYALLQACKLIDMCKSTAVTHINRFFIHLGKRSIDIVIWHFVFFRIVIIIQMIMHSEALTLSNIFKYYPLYSEKHGWWIAYLFVGTAVPLLWCDFLRLNPWGKLLKKLHVV